MKHLFIQILCIAGIIVLIHTQCRQVEKPLKPKAIRLVDTLVARQWSVLEPNEDSLCVLESIKIFEFAYDSILEIRLQEKNELIQYEVN